MDAQYLRNSSGVGFVSRESACPGTSLHPDQRKSTQSLPNNCGRERPHGTTLMIGEYAIGEYCGF